MRMHAATYQSYSTPELEAAAAVVKAGTAVMLSGTRQPCSSLHRRLLTTADMDAHSRQLPHALSSGNLIRHRRTRRSMELHTLTSDSASARAPGDQKSIVLLKNDGTVAARQTTVNPWRHGPMRVDISDGTVAAPTQSLHGRITAAVAPRERAYPWTYRWRGVNIATGADAAMWCRNNRRAQHDLW